MSSKITSRNKKSASSQAVNRGARASSPLCFASCGTLVPCSTNSPGSAGRMPAKAGCWREEREPPLSSRAPLDSRSSHTTKHGRDCLGVFTEGAQLLPPHAHRSSIHHRRPPTRDAATERRTAPYLQPRTPSGRDQRSQPQRPGPAVPATSTAAGTNGPGYNGAAPTAHSHGQLGELSLPDARSRTRRSPLPPPGIEPGFKV